MRMSLRTGSKCHLDHQYIENLIAALKDCGNCFDEVWLATSYGIPTREQNAKYTEDMAWAAEKFREAGVSASMQVSRTVGHHPDSLKTNGGDGVEEAFDVITSWDGVESPGVFCWNNEAFRSYVYDTLNTCASYHPEIVWVDDDIRLRLIGKSKALCFCDNCIRIFNEKYGYNYTRPELKARFLADTDFRAQYVAVQTETLADFAGLISKAIHDASPETVMALQNGGNTMLAINAQKACLDEMYRVSEKAPGFRAGGGFYNDHKPDGMFMKAMILNYMNSRLPEYVKHRSCEIENLPFNAYGKSPECTPLEAALYLAYGCNEASVTLMRQNETLEWHKRLFNRLTQYRPYFDKYTAHNEDTVNAGICFYQPPKSNFVPCNENAEPFWNDTCIWEAADCLRHGLPMHTSPVGCAYYLSDKTCDFLSAEDMEFLAGQTVVADAKTILKLQEKGLASCLKGEAYELPEALQNGVRSSLVAHPVNEGTDPRADSFGGIAHGICGAEIEVLAQNFSCKDGSEQGASAAIIHTTKGAKWVVVSFELNRPTQSYPNRELIRRALDYACATPMAAYIGSPEQMVVVPRVNKAGKTVSVMCMNVAITDSEAFEVVVANPANEKGCTLINPYGEDTFIPFEKRGDRFVATLPALQGWRVVSILI